MAFYAVYIVGTLVLPPLAARPHQSEEVQWMEQLTNSVVQLCFLLGALGIRKRVVPATADETENVGVST